MEKKILRTIREHNMLEEGMHVVVGLSGGPDSLCMFDVLCSLAGRWQLHLYPVHVNHKFRPGAAEEDQHFVEDWCADKGWPCRSFVYDCNSIAEKEGLTPEEAGRKVRYEAFGQVADEIAAAGVSRGRIAIAVGQNAGDQAETVLFRILRGTGVDGISGIAYKRWDRAGNAVIRPLLDCTRDEIEGYCREHQLQPRRDHTNETTVYMRNRIRLELLPLLKEQYNPNMAAALNRLAAAASCDSDFIWQQAAEAWGQAAVTELPGRFVELSIEVLAKFHPAVRIRVYHKALEQIGLGENIGAGHLEGIERVLDSESPSASWNLPDGFVAEKRYGGLCFYKVSNFVESAGLMVRTLSIGDAERGVCDAAVIDDAERDACDAAVIGDATRDACDAAVIGDAERGACDAAVLNGAKAVCAASVRFSLDALKDAYGEAAQGNIVLRTREKGDFMVISTGGGLHRKKLQDILVDMKIPKNLREQVKLAAIGSEILWILPGNGRDGASGCGAGRVPPGLERLGKNGRCSAAYPYNKEDKTESQILVLEYLVQV